MREGRGDSFARRVDARVLVISALASCYAASPQQGAPCNPNAPACPDGQRCVLVGNAYFCMTGDGDTPTEDGGIGSGSDDVGSGSDAGGTGSDASTERLDSDDDGIDDASDNCPTIGNATQRDEDADSIGDVCDVCPPNADNSDGDGDGVGDRCDPNPTIGGEQIILFEGFAGGIPNGWTGTGMWTTSNGALVGSGSGSGSGSGELGGPASTLVTTAMSSARHTLYTRVTITAQDATTSSAVGLVDGVDAAANGGVACGGQRSLFTGAVLTVINLSTIAIGPSAPHAFAVGTVFDLQVRRTPSGTACTDRSVNQTVNGEYAASGGFVGFRSRSVTAAFDWFLLVRSP